MLLDRSRSITDPTVIQLLFEISKALHDSIDIINEDYQQKLHLICRFLQMVDFGEERNRFLTFLVKCRAAFSCFDAIMNTLVLLSNNLAIGAIKGTSKFTNFVKACVAFSEVTIPSILNRVRCLKLFISTAEVYRSLVLYFLKGEYYLADKIDYIYIIQVSLFAGLVSHTEGLLNSAIDCLLGLDVSGTYKSNIEDEILSLTCKMCSVLSFIPGVNGGSAQLQRNIMSVVNQPWASPRMKTKTLCAIIYLCACLSQKLFPHPANNMKAVGNEDMIFFGDKLYEEELSVVTSDALQYLFKAIEEAPTSPLKGNLALEVCNCLIINFKATEELHGKCLTLLDIAGSCLSSKDRYLNASVKLLNKHFQNVSSLSISCKES